MVCGEFFFRPLSSDNLVSLRILLLAKCLSKIDAASGLAPAIRKRATFLVWLINRAILSVVPSRLAAGWASFSLS